MFVFLAFYAFLLLMLLRKKLVNEIMQIMLITKETKVEIL